MNAPRVSALVVLGAALVGFGTRAAGTPTAEPPRGRALAGSELARRTQEVAGLLRCPVCQGLSVADSPSDMARAMKAQVQEKLAAGYDEEQILAHFVASYGEFVLLRPPVRGINGLLWFGPPLSLAVGAAVVWWTLRRQKAAASSASTDDERPEPDTLPDDPRLAAAVRDVRARAYGWPDGLSPARRAAASASDSTTGKAPAASGGHRD